MQNFVKKVAQRSVSELFNKLGYSIVPNQPTSQDTLSLLTMQQSLLKEIDHLIPSTSPGQIPQLFREVPIEVFGRLLLDVPDDLPNLKSYFPTMASNEVQMQWTGSTGVTLLNQSLTFVKTLIYGYGNLTGRNLESSKVLDFGCGWGRLIRLLYKFTSSQNIFGVDPWDKSLEECRKHKLMGNLAQSDWVPKTLPFKQKFDLVYAFSVFTHLSEKTAHSALDTLRRHISDDGILVITVRPIEFWSKYKGGIYAETAPLLHQEHGFAFIPHSPGTEVNGEVVYGDTSVSLEYIKSRFNQWELVMVEHNMVDPQQVIIFMRPS